MIQDDLVKQEEFFKSIGDGIKAQRIKERVEYDMEMIKELGHCSGIENYSQIFRRPTCRRTPLLSARLLPERFPPGGRREPCEHSADRCDVWWRQGPKAEPGGIWFPFACRLRQPSAHLRGVSQSDSSGHLRECHPQPTMS